MSLILPQTTLNLLQNVPVEQRHAGLQLDKLSEPGDQTVQKRALADVVIAANGQSTHASEFGMLRQRWLANMTAVGVISPLNATTIGPLTLHLSRASALENAGICLHPLYGFAYLPGSGLKGMARAFAETIWLPGQADQQQAWRRIEDVFGWAPNPDRKRQVNDPDHPAQRRRANDADPNSLEVKAHVGDVVFHDAWPDKWPELIVDIVNNHHPDYYQHDDNHHAPGDWENPVPVYFLAVKPAATFTFPLAKRTSDVADELLDLARQWLLGALCHLGAGAKTAVGYGAFKPVNAEIPALQSPSRAVFETTLELVTPAFLAGANQKAEDCELRQATLRGQLRWWWRTMHAGFLDVKSLRALEAAIWGDTKSGGAVRIVVEKADGTHPQPYDKRSKANFNDQQKVSDLGIPNGDARKTTQGLWYASYGMDEGGQNNRRQRQVVEPPASWRLRLVARCSRLDGNSRELTAPQVLEQAQAALWLLCQYGGVGSKAGKGFGSLSMTDLPDRSLDQTKRCGSELRQALQLSNSFVESTAASPALEHMLGPVEATFTWSSIWSVLDQIGFAFQTFAKKYKHKRQKLALGLPRRIGNPAQGTFQPTLPVTTNGRHTSPVRIHVERTSGGYAVRAIAFPAAKLPNLTVSRTFLNEFLKDFGADMQRRAALSPPSSPPSAGGGGRQMPQRTTQRQQPVTPSRPQPGQRVEATLLEEKTKKGGWKAKHETSGLSGPIQNSGDVPGEKNVGDRLTLIVASATERGIAFRYPTAADEQRAEKSQNKPKGGRGGQGPRGRR
jgi:CRISPR-associated protein Cmr6